MSQASLQADQETLRQLLEAEQLTLREAGQRVGLSSVSIFRLANRYGIQRRRRHRAKHCREQIYQMRMDGVPTAEIAKRVGCAVRTVLSVAKDFERHETNHALGIEDEGPFTRAAWGDDAAAATEPVSVQPWRCPKHGLVRVRPCVACLAEGS